GILGIERAGRGPRVGHGLDVVGSLMVEDVVESGERKENEEHVSRADTEETRARRHARVLAGRGGPEAGGDPGDVGAVANRRLAVGEVLGEDIDALLARLRGGVSERDYVTQAENDLHVLDGVAGIDE